MLPLRRIKLRLETRIEKTRVLPDVSLRINYLTTAGISFLPQNVGAVGALLTWQPWNWGQKRHNIAQKVIAEHEAVLTEEDARDQVLLDVDSQFRKLREARVQLAVAESARARNKKGFATRLMPTRNRQFCLALCCSSRHRSQLQGRISPGFTCVLDGASRL